MINWEGYYKYRYEMYKDFIIKNGGDEKLFDIPYIQEIIMDIIKYGDPRLVVEGKSTLYYKNPNEDGTFDICGRMDGPTVDLCYKMSKHLGLILINKYVLERDYSGYSTPLISRQDIVIYLPDYVVDEIETIWKTRPSESTLLTSLKASGYIKSTS